MKLYVAYGSNMNIKQMKKRCPNAKIKAKGFLTDYKLSFMGRGHANIIKNKGSIVPIVLWSITNACEQSLDKYEGYPTYYKKENVDININNNKVTALTYVMANKYNKAIKRPTDDYYKIIQEGYIQNEIGLSYLKKALKEVS